MRWDGFPLEQNDPEAEIEGRSVGNWEALIAGPGIFAACEEAAGWNFSSGKEKSKLRPDSTVKELFSLAKHGDVLALQVVKEQAVLMGMGMANIISLINPEIVILGGSVGANAAFLLPQIREIVLQHAQPISAKSVEIVTSKLGTQAGLLGAAYGVLLRLNNSASHENNERR